MPAPKPEPLNVVIVNDHVALRRGMELLLRRAGHHIVGSADDAESGEAMILRRKPDVALVDLALPGMSGAELTRRLLSSEPELRIILYTGAADERQLLDALDYLDPRLAGGGGTTTLSPREREILGLLSRGLSGEQAAKRLFLSSETVRTHVRNAMSKLGAATRVHAVALALRRGEIEL